MEYKGMCEYYEWQVKSPWGGHPVCIMGRRASVKCHSENRCPDYKEAKELRERKLKTEVI